MRRKGGGYSWCHSSFCYPKERCDIIVNCPILCLCCPPARRLAMYQEMDSEEDECPSRGGTLPRRDSVGSHHSVKVVLRSHSTKSHRRTGSRAEAKRASILSKHTAFSSPMVCVAPITP